MHRDTDTQSMWDLAATKSSRGLKIATSENLLVRGRQPDLQNADILPAANRTNPKFTAAAGGPISTNIFRRGLNHQPVYHINSYYSIQEIWHEEDLIERDFTDTFTPEQK